MVAIGFRNGIQVALVLSLFLAISITDTASALYNPALLGGFLQAKGRWIVDEAGNIVILRGINFSGYEYGSPWNDHTEQDYHKIASWGFNVVRLPIAWNFLEPQTGRYDTSYLSKYVDRDIAWARKYRLYVILDVHQYGWSPHFTYFDNPTAGVPGWSVSAYPNTAEGEARAKADFWNGLGPNGSPATASNPSMQDRFILMWKFLATRYSREWRVAGYDLLNEPNTYSSDWKINYFDSNAFCSITSTEFLGRVVDGIRGVDGKHMFFWGTGQCLTAYSAPVSAVNRPNMVFSPHYPGAYGISKYNGKTAQFKASIETTVIQPSRAWNQPVFIGEWGMVAQGINVTQFIRDMSDIMDTYLLGAAWWTYGRGTFGMNLLDAKGNERSVLTSNLVRPYLRVSSLSPSYSELRQDGTEFRVSVSGSGPAVLTIYLPSTYSSYTVKVDTGSASASWSAAQGVVTISMPTGASQVVVSLT